MGGEHRLHQARAQQRADALRVDAGGGGFDERLPHRLAAGGRPRLLLPLAQHAEALVLLGEVHQVEIGGEGADEKAALVEAEPVRAGAQAAAGLAEVVAVLAHRRAHLLGGGSVLLHEREAGLAFLLPQHVPEEPAQRVDVGAQRIGLGLAGRHEQDSSRLTGAPRSRSLPG